MTNHQSRTRRNAEARKNYPTPAEIIATREAAELTQTEAAELVYTTCRVWQQWEADEASVTHRRMHLAFWELFKIKAKAKK